MSTTCVPAGTSAARNRIRKSPFGATHGLCPASANVGRGLRARRGAPGDERRAGDGDERERPRRAGSVPERQGGGSQRPPEDAQARGEDVEAERAVEREGASVLQLRVHVDAVATLLPDPVQAVGDECMTPTP